MNRALKGMCENGTRVLHYENAYDINLTPLTVSKYAFSEPNEPFTVTIILNHITTQSDYQIFNSYKMGNTSEVFDLIEAHRGVNAVDEWGYTLLMLATQKGDLQTVALLLNTRMPKVDVNKAKSVCIPILSSRFLVTSSPSNRMVTLHSSTRSNSLQHRS